MMLREAIDLAPWQMVALNNPFEHFAMLGGVGSGKSYTGSHFAIQHFIDHPQLMGFIGANTYDQLSQASLKELFYWLEVYRIPFVYNKQPHASWGARVLPSYKNILSVKIGPKVAYAFTRVLSDPDALRGIQFSWYWLDESRDTPHNTHDVLLSRMRESSYRRGLITTTTNGEDWVYKRFVKARNGQKLYGSLHVKTIDAVHEGILTQEYYDTMIQSYSDLMVAQELNAEHVNVLGGRAYYSVSGANRRLRAPWGFRNPDPEYALVLGCDFNFDPSPHVWVVGQLSPDGTKIHWFREFARNRCSTTEMAETIASQYGDFFVRVYGDRSGIRSTTSNAGKHDYNQIADVFAKHGMKFTIDSDQSNNPLVRNRVENVNRMAKDGAGNIRMTYDPQKCPLLDEDLKMVGWKQTVRTGQGKLDNGGNNNLTHASDAIGYAIWKLFPPGNRGKITRGAPSLATQLVGERRK